MKRNTKSDRVVIGTNRLTGKLVYVNEDEFREKHTHVLGIPGVGKSSFLEYLMRTFISRGRGLCLIDPDGDLYRNMLRFVVDQRLEDRVILIDPNDQEWTVGLNMLEYDERGDVVAHVEEVMEELALVVGENPTDFKPQHDRWTRNALALLTEQRLTIVELMQFGDIKDPIVRRKLLRATKLEIGIVEEWRRFDEDAPREQRSEVASLLNRAASFSTGRAKSIYGQTKSTINFRAAMDEGKVILVNLNAEHISAKARRMIGVDILYKIRRAARSRSDLKREDRRPFYVFVDEFGSIVSTEMADSLDTLRKFGAYFFLSHQRLGQLRRGPDENLLSAVLADTRLKFIFSIWRPDAEIIVPDIYGAMIHGDKKKLVLKRRAFAPRIEWVDIHTTTTSHTEGGAKGTAVGGGTGSSTATGASQLLQVGEGLFAVPTQVGATDSRNDSASWQEHHSESEQSIWSGGQSESATRSPLTVHDEYEETASVQFYTPDELERKFITWVSTQKDREVTFSKRGGKPIPLITPDVAPVRVRLKDVEEFKQVVYSKYALPAPEAAKQIEERRQQLLEVSEEEEDALPAGEDEPKTKRKLKQARIRVPVVEQNPHE